MAVFAMHPEAIRGACAADLQGYHPYRAAGNRGPDSPPASHPKTGEKDFAGRCSFIS